MLVTVSPVRGMSQLGACVPSEGTAGPALPRVPAPGQAPHSSTQGSLPTLSSICAPRARRHHASRVSVPFGPAPDGHC